MKLDWMTLQDAFEHIKSKVLSPLLAERQLLRALSERKFYAKADCIHFGYPCFTPPKEIENVLLRPEFWQASSTRISWDGTSSIFGKGSTALFSIKLSAADVGELSPLFLAYQVFGIRVPRSEIFGRWPLGENGTEAQASSHRSDPKPRGRTPAADWEAIKDALRIEVKLRGWPERQNGDMGWRSQADAERFVANIIRDRNERGADSTVREHTSRMLSELKAEKARK